ncbi:MAG: hypothetical protein Q9184_003995 [Pyrenodesmia sp. 2 TL-2023]
MEVGVGVGVAASTITIFQMTCTLASQVKELVQNAKRRDENLKELEDKLNCLNIILVQAKNIYGSGESIPFSKSKKELRIALENVIMRCKTDLTRFQAKLKDLLQHGNWAIVAWKQQVAAPALAKIRVSISEHQQQLSLLVQLLQGPSVDQTSVTADQIMEMFGTLINTLTNRSVQGTTAETMISEVTEALKEKQDLGGEAYSDTTETLEGGKEPEYEEGNLNGRRLLKAIEGREYGTFESLILDGATSLKETDSKDRTPLLLAAHLGEVDMVKKLLAINAHDKDEERDHYDNHRENNITNGTSPLCRIRDDDKGPENTSHRQIDFNATDNVGRTALHYCAEYDMCDMAYLLLDHGVDVNARDHRDYPPTYFAAKNRKYFATELLLARGAATDFEWPTPTSFEIEQLLRKYANNDPLAPVSSAGSSGHSSASTPSP